MPQLSLKDFARTIGKKYGAVKMAVSDGRLHSSVKRQGRRVFIDLDMGREELLGIKPDEKQKAAIEVESTEIPTLDESMAVEKFWKAKTAELAYRREAARLVEASTVRASYRAEVAHCREAVQAVIPKITDRAIDASAKDLLIVSELITESLEELGRINPT